MEANPHPRGRLLAAATALAAVAVIALATIGLLGSAAAADPLAQASASKRVSIVNFAFKPAALTVPAGTKVEFENEGTVAHTVTRTNGFDSKRIRPGNSYSVRFKRSGTFSYHCKIHPEMRGKIVVQ